MSSAGSCCGLAPRSRPTFAKPREHAQMMNLFPNWAGLCRRLMNRNFGLNCSVKIVESSRNSPNRWKRKQKNFWPF